MFTGKQSSTFRLAKRPNTFLDIVVGYRRTHCTIMLHFESNRKPRIDCKPRHHSIKHCVRYSRLTIQFEKSSTAAAVLKSSTLLLAYILFLKDLGDSSHFMSYASANIFLYYASFRASSLSTQAMIHFQNRLTYPPALLIFATELLPPF